MDIGQIRKNSSYLFYCREFYFQNIRPANRNSKQTKEYKILVDIAKLYFANGLQNEFAGSLREYQYLVQLWTAHLILEYGSPEDKLLKLCLDEIENYSKTPLNKELADEEASWLAEYYRFK